MDVVSVQRLEGAKGILPQGYYYVSKGQRVRMAGTVFRVVFLRVPRAGTHQKT